jgi:hypothetical protein
MAGAETMNNGEKGGDSNGGGDEPELAFGPLGQVGGNGHVVPSSQQVAGL